MARFKSVVCQCAIGVALVAFIAGEVLAETKDDERPPHHESDSRPVSAQEPPGESQGVKIEGTGITLKFGGFAKVDVIQDFDPIGNVDQFKVGSIPVSGDPSAGLGGATNVSAKQTRFSLDVRGDTEGGLVRTYLEGDFFGNSGAFRMRHGYGEWKGLLGGQTWTTFQDIEARPFTLDYEGPDTELFVRQPMIRYTRNVREGVALSVALEDPTSEITVADTTIAGGTGRSEFPDVPANVHINGSWGHAQVAAVVRQLRFVSSDGAVTESTVGWGVDVSAKAHIGQQDALMGHVAVGSGIGRYIEAFTGTDSDAVITDSGELVTLSAWAFVVGVTHYWKKRLHSTLSGGYAQLDNDAAQVPAAIKATRSGHVNLVYEATHLLNLGAELMYGERENHDGAKGDAVRTQFSVQFKFR